MASEVPGRTLEAIVAELRAVLTAATPAPWRASLPSETEPNSPAYVECNVTTSDEGAVDGDLLGVVFTGGAGKVASMLKGTVGRHHTNAQAIAALRNHADAVLDELQRLSGDGRTRAAAMTDTEYEMIRVAVARGVVMAGYGATEVDAVMAPVDRLRDAARPPEAGAGMAPERLASYQRSVDGGAMFSSADVAELLREIGAAREAVSLHRALVEVLPRCRGQWVEHEGYQHDCGRPATFYWQNTNGRGARTNPWDASTCDEHVKAEGRYDFGRWAEAPWAPALRLLAERWHAAADAIRGIADKETRPDAQ